MINLSVPCPTLTLVAQHPVVMMIDALCAGIDAEHALYIGSQIPVSLLVRGVRGAYVARFVLAVTRVTNRSDQFRFPVEFLNPKIQLPIAFGEQISVGPQFPDRHGHDIPHLGPRVAVPPGASRPGDVRQEVSPLAQDISRGNRIRNRALIIEGCP